LFLFLV